MFETNAIEAIEKRTWRIGDGVHWRGILRKLRSLERHQFSSTSKDKIHQCLCGQKLYRPEHTVCYKKALEIIKEGVLRHFNASYSTDVAPDFGAINEIILDALTGRAIWKESDEVFIKELGNENKQEFKKRLKLKSVPPYM